MEINKIYNMNCVDGLKQIPQNSVDLIFTDPPYKLTSGGRKNSKLHGNTFTTSGEVFKTPTLPFSDWIPLLYPIAKEGAYIFIMTNDRNMRSIWDICEKSGFIFCELLVMNKNLVSSSTYFFKSCEFILMFRKGKYKKLNKYGQKNVIDVKMPKGKNKIHPTQKPEELIIPIIETCSKEGDLILDLFMGSCITAYVAKKLNRNYLGFEIDKNYYRIGIETMGLT